MRRAPDVAAGYSSVSQSALAATWLVIMAGKAGKQRRSGAEPPQDDEQQPLPAVLIAASFNRRFFPLSKDQPRVRPTQPARCSPPRFA